MSILYPGPDPEQPNPDPDPEIAIPIEGYTYLKIRCNLVPAARRRRFNRVIATARQSSPLLVLHESDLPLLLVAESSPPLPPAAAAVICCCCHCHLLSIVAAVMVLLCCHYLSLLLMENYDEKEVQEVEVEGDLKQQVLFYQKGTNKDDGVVKVSGGFSQEACRMALVKMIVKDELPFSFVEAKGFLEFMQTCCPRFDVPSQKTITRDFLELYQHEKRILSFTPIANHKGDGIGKLIEACLIDWGIERLFTITVDNASANNVAITYVKKKLANWNGLPEANHSITSIRNAVKYVRSSLERLQKFKTCVDREKISYGGLTVLDVPTRWNSTYLMLHKAVVFEKAFDRMKEDDRHYVNWFVEDEGEKKREGLPSDDDWANVRSDDLLRKMAEKMEQKFAKYWGDSFDQVNMLLFVANVLDPRSKLEFVTYFFSSMYESRKVEELKYNIKELLMKLYNSYIGGSDVRNSGGVCFGDIHDGGGGGGASSSIMSIDIFSSFKMMKQSSNDDISSKNDVEKYLMDANESTSNAHFDILTWWKLNGHRHPILSQIAKDVLAIPVSTIASESTFSTRWRVLDPFRSFLTHKIVESLICTKN
ncbi:BED-type domain-containing protein [Citrus sinensis]|uniref:BED-type domain-containing protein n=1 Tax=Citrus sinensis TaxID=2711 RepID=A0ACB8JKH3_CITSI|nr:BED-type domain-containing protein [Citrus sinensis]